MRALLVAGMRFAEAELAKNHFFERAMLRKFRLSELLILFLAVFLIFVSEYYYLVLKDHDRAVFIGLWPPTMMLFLVYFNLKKQQ